MSTIETHLVKLVSLSRDVRALTGNTLANEMLDAIGAVRSEIADLQTALQSVHDDACHALGTDSEPNERLSVARQDLETIKTTSRAALGDIENAQPCPGAGWRLLNEGEPLQPGDGFQHPDQPGQWIDYDCRPNLFRGAGIEGTAYYTPKREWAHTWPWRRRVE